MNMYSYIYICIYSFYNRAIGANRDNGMVCISILVLYGFTRIYDAYSFRYGFTYEYSIVYGHMSLYIHAYI
jgi:hypothetical protein